MNNNVLYLSYDGMTDQMGQAQVIPYLLGLAKEGFSFTVISFEKKDLYEKGKDRVVEQFKSAGITWVTMWYTKSPPVLSTVYDLWRMKRKAVELNKKTPFSIVHCRGYISALVGESMRKKFGTKMIFDTRGFFPDERVDIGNWKLDNPLYNTIYKFFKRKEADFLGHANYSICVTENAKKEIHSWKNVSNQPCKLQVIPCCADLELFSEASINKELAENLKQQYGIKDDDFVLGYLGSLSTWYLPDELMDFYKALLRQKPSARFFFVTAEPKEFILQRARERGIPFENIVIAQAKRQDVPTYLSLSTVSIFFVKPVYSKINASPIKQGEIMGMGIPHICNANVGDVEDIVTDTKSGYVVRKFDDHEYNAIINSILHKPMPNKDTVRAGAYKYYSLQEGVKKYLFVYREVLK